MQFLCVLCLLSVAAAFKVEFKFDADETCYVATDCNGLPQESSILPSSIRQINDSITESFSFLQKSLEMMNKSLTNALKKVEDLIEKGMSVEQH